MAPFYRGYKPTLRLAEDDIAAIQALYGDMPTKKNKKHLHADTSVSASPASGNSWPRSPPARRGPEEPGHGVKPNPGMNPGMMPPPLHPDPDIYNTVHPGFPIWPDIWDPPITEPIFGGLPPSIPNPILPGPDICHIDRMDAITMNTNGETFVFKGQLRLCNWCALH